MTPHKAIEHFKWKLQNKWKPTKVDIEAFNAVKNYVVEKEKQQLIDNQLFGKLYIYLYGEFVTYYKASVMDDIPQKELHKLLDKPLKMVVESVRDRINLYEMDYHMKKNKNLKEYSELDYDELADNLRIMVNGALNEYNKDHKLKTA